MKINFKFKRSAPGWMIFDDFSGQPVHFKNGSKYEEELRAYLDAGKKIEPPETREEAEAKELEKKQQELELQDAKCSCLLSETDKKMLPDWPYPEDQAAWSTYRAELRSIRGCGETRTIPKKPF